MPTTIIIISYNCPRNDKTARAGRISVKQMILHNSGQWSRHTIGTSLGFSRLDGKGRGLSDWSSCSLELSRFAQHRLFITGIFKQIEFEDLKIFCLTFVDKWGEEMLQILLIQVVHCKQMDYHTKLDDFFIVWIKTFSDFEVRL